MTPPDPAAQSARRCPLALDPIDRALVDRLQAGIPVCDHPFEAVAAVLGITEADVVARVGALVRDGVLSRFGPLWNAERLGGAVTLAAMRVPADALDRVVAALDAMPAVAHNYERDHAFNLWFVLSVVDAAALDAARAEIEARTGFPVYAFPKEREYFVGLQLAA